MNRSFPLAIAVAALTLAGCAAFEADDGAGGDEEASRGTTVLTSFYPLQYLAEEIGGDRLEVTSLTPPNVDPHNLELAPRTVADMADAALVVHLSGFQPAVDEAVAVTGARAFDAADHTELLTAGQTGHEHAEEDAGHEHAEGAHDGHDDAHDEHEGDDAHDEHEHDDAHDEHEGDDGHGHEHESSGDGALDAHFWLDPVRLAEVGEALSTELSEIDPDGAATYRANAEELVAELHALDEELAAGLASCERDTIVVAHEAYGYLTAEHGLRQEGLSGLDPESEPSPARLAEIADVVAEHDVDTIFVESLLSPAVSETLAEDLGLRTAVLDPLENQQDESADYLDVMRANLGAMQEALGCVAR